MILAFLDISIWINLTVIAHVVVSALLILVILMQRPKQEGLGAAFGSGVTDAAWGARTTDVLQRATVYLGTLFFVLSLVLSIMVGKKNSIDNKRADSTPSDETEEVIEEIEAPAPIIIDAAADFAKEEEAATGGTAPVEETPAPVEETPAPLETPAEETPAGQ
ncbi:preprotein translocase subunit SecG [Akkermansiaceae bacterium]|nr:preprotein translocase subunit SecG [Akkermansiaceae bacterium]MDB4419054.1 preprotein translocase subunit SecG [bacterium]MDB4436087.1 preprotein translocase subunit SecG [Akkermansiaceae bacterium]